MKSKLKEKKWFFRSAEEASVFQLYIATLNTSGSILSSVFHALDSTESLKLTWRDLKRAGGKYGLQLSQIECEGMIDIISNKKSIDYLDFFQFFMRSPVTGVESCIFEWRNQLADDLKKSQPRASRATIDSLGSYQNRSDESRYLGNDAMPTLVPGEIILTVCQHVRYTLYPPFMKSPKPPFVGNLYFTTFRLIFSSYIRSQSSISTRYVIPPCFDEITLPLSTISKIEILKGGNGGNTNTNTCNDIYSLAIHCKDLRVFRIAFNASDPFTITFASGLSAQAFPTSASQYFAFSYKNSFPECIIQSYDGWNIYNIRKEFTRQEVLQCDLWRIWSDNYYLVDTYPKEFILPAGLSMTDITEAAKFRSRGRIPALTWRNQRTGAVLCRSSQPMVGVLGHKSLADKLLLNLYRVRGDVNDVEEIENPSDFYVMDCRKNIAATANSALGKGVEDEKNYQRTKVLFLDIENIHVMRASLKLVEEAIVVGGYGSVEDLNMEDAKFSTKIDASEWLIHSRRILVASVSVAEKLELERASVLVHCSDGWDRTAQVCAIAELLLDPYYRTLEGFGVLIEKDWCAFGHKFLDRLAHCDSNSESSSERSPVFLQWLDVVHLVLLQFPNQFQFTEKLLVFIADTAYSCQFGTFFGNSEKQRKELDCENKTVSVWTYVLRNSQLFINPSYGLYPGPLWPSLSSHHCRFWERYFLRWEPDMHPRPTSGNDWRDDWGLSVASTPSSLLRPPSTRTSQAHDSAGDSNISRPLSVVYGTISDPFREAMNSIQELKKPNETTQNAETEAVEQQESTDLPSHPLKPAVSFEEIYPEENEDDVTFTHLNHPGRPDENKDSPYRHKFYAKNPDKLYSRTSRFQAL